MKVAVRVAKDTASPEPISVVIDGIANVPGGSVTLGLPREMALWLRDSLSEALAAHAATGS